MESKTRAVTQMRTNVIRRGQHLRFNEPHVPPSAISVFPDSAVPHLYHSAVENVLQLKMKERDDMQGLNERFASYIENVRFLEAQNKELLVQIENLKRKKEYDSSELKTLYEKELAECRRVIDASSTEKVNTDAQVVSLEERLDAEKRDKEDLEKQNGDLKHRIDRLNSHIGDYDGELKNLKMKVEFIEGEMDKLKDTNKRLRDENSRLQGDLDFETVKRLTAENDLQSVTEHYKFQMNVQDTEISELRGLIDSQKCVDMSGIWKGELRKAVSEIQTEYDRQLEIVRIDMEQKMVLQLQKMQAGVNRDNMEIKQSKDENTLLKSRLEMMTSKIGDLETELAKQKVQAQMEMETKIELEKDYNTEIRKLRDIVREYEKRIEEFIDELKILQNAKLSLETEIMMYRKLLESEEKKFAFPRNVDDTSLNEIRERKQDLVRQGTVYDEIVGNVKINKVCRSKIVISKASIDGAYVTLENTGQQKQALKGWRIVRENERGRITSEYIFGDVRLEAGKDLTIFAAGDESEHHSDKDLSGSFYTWGAGSGEYKLYDTDSQDVMSSLSMEFSLQNEQATRNS